MLPPTRCVPIFPGFAELRQWTLPARAFELYFTRRRGTLSMASQFPTMRSRAQAEHWYSAQSSEAAVASQTVVAPHSRLALVGAVRAGSGRGDGGPAGAHSAESHARQPGAVHHALHGDAAAAFAGSVWSIPLCRAAGRGRSHVRFPLALPDGGCGGRAAIDALHFGCGGGNGRGLALPAHPASPAH